MRVMSPREHSYFANDRSILCVALRPDGPDTGYTSLISIVCMADGGIFIPIFKQQEKGDGKNDNAQTGSKQHLVQGA